jgi:hypothetical protein
LPQVVDSGLVQFVLYSSFSFWHSVFNQILVSMPEINLPWSAPVRFDIEWSCLRLRLDS